MNGRKRARRNIVPEKANGGKKPRTASPISKFELVLLPILPQFISFLDLDDILDGLVHLSKGIRNKVMNGAQTLRTQVTEEILNSSSPYIDVRKRYPRLIAEKCMITMRERDSCIRAAFLLRHPNLYIEFTRSSGVKGRDLMQLVDSKITESSATSILIENSRRHQFSLRDVSFPKLDRLLVLHPGAYEVFSRAEQLETLTFAGGPDMAKFQDVACRETIRSLRILEGEFDPSATYVYEWRMTRFPRLEHLTLRSGIVFPQITTALKSLHITADDTALNLGLNRDVTANLLDVCFETKASVQMAWKWRFRTQEVRASYRDKKTVVTSTHGRFAWDLVRKVVCQLLDEPWVAI